MVWVLCAGKASKLLERVAQGGPEGGHGAGSHGKTMLVTSELHRGIGVVGSPEVREFLAFGLEAGAPKLVLFKGSSKVCIRIGEATRGEAVVGEMFAVFVTRKTVGGGHWLAWARACSQVYFG